MKQFKHLKVSESLRKFGKKMQKSLKVLLFWIFVVYIKLTVKLCFEHALQKKNYTEHFLKDSTSVALLYISMDNRWA